MRIATRALGLALHLLLHGTRGRGERDGERHAVAVDLHLFDHAERDEILLQVRIVDGRERLTHLRFGEAQERPSASTEVMPFLLAGVAGVSNLNQPDGMHPNEKGEQIVANNVWAVLEPVLRQLDANPTAG